MIYDDEVIAEAFAKFDAEHPAPREVPAPDETMTAPAVVAVATTMPVSRSSEPKADPVGGGTPGQLTAETSIEDMVDTVLASEGGSQRLDGFYRAGTWQ